MTVKHDSNGVTVTYNDDEWSFIESLNETAKRYILRGMATPYDYGYKPNSTRRV